MDEHIKKEKIFKLLEHPKSADPLIGSVLLAVRKAVENLPADDVEPVRHGRWVDRYGGKYSNPLYECSECKEIALYKQKKDCLGNDCFEQELSAACPRCRAKMDGGADDGAES